MSDKETIELLIRIDERTKNIDEKIEDQNRRMDSHALKIRGLEKWRNIVVGAGSVLGALVGIKQG